MFIKLNFNHLLIRSTLCIVFTFSGIMIDLGSYQLDPSLFISPPTLSLNIAKAKKRKSYRAKKKTKKRSKSKAVKKKRTKSRSKARRKRARKSSRRSTGVKSLWRKDGRNKESRKRWQNTRSRVKDRIRTKRSSSGANSKYRSQRRRSVFRYRRNISGTSSSSSSSSSSSVNPQNAPVQRQEFLQSDRSSPHLVNPHTVNGHQDHPAHLSPTAIDYKPSIMALSHHSWIDALELEFSSTLWDFNSPLIRSNDDDWTESEAEARYQVSPQVMYRGQLRLYSRFIDLDINYESKAGLSFLSEQGTWLDLAFALPELIPALAPLSLSYRRVRFANGKVDLINWNTGPVERQKFEMYVDRYEARWVLMESLTQRLSPPNRLYLFFAYDQRAIPRHIYLEERVRIDEENSYSVYYGISDQLLWTPIDSYDLGTEIRAGFGSHLQVNMGVSVGLGSYELLSPLSGELIDKGSLAILGFKAGVHYELPLASFISLKASYQVQGRAFSPNGLPDQLEQELTDEAWNLDGLHLSFGTVDLLHRVGLSLVLRLAEK